MRTNRPTAEVELVGTSNSSECTRGSEMQGAYLAVSHTAGGDGETDSTRRRCVPQPSAIAPVRYHVSYCALPAGARFGGELKAQQMDSASWTRSPSTLSGRQRGRPRGTWSGRMPSSKGRAWVESWQLAPVSLIAKGMPWPSQIRWRCLPRLEPYLSDLVQSAARCR